MLKICSVLLSLCEGDQHSQIVDQGSSCPHCPLHSTVTCPIPVLGDVATTLQFLFHLEVGVNAHNVSARLFSGGLELLFQVIVADIDPSSVSQVSVCFCVCVFLCLCVVWSAVALERKRLLSLCVCVCVCVCVLVSKACVSLTHMLEGGEPIVALANQSHFNLEGAKRMGEGERERERENLKL